MLEHDHFQSIFNEKSRIVWAEQTVHEQIESRGNFQVGVEYSSWATEWLETRQIKHRTIIDLVAKNSTSAWMGWINDSITINATEIGLVEQRVESQRLGTDANQKWFSRKDVSTNHWQYITVSNFFEVQLLLPI